VPGDFHGCVPLAEIGAAWALNWPPASPSLYAGRAGRPASPRRREHAVQKQQPRPGRRWRSPRPGNRRASREWPRIRWAGSADEDRYRRSRRAWKSPPLSREQWRKKPDRDNRPLSPILSMGRKRRRSRAMRSRKATD